MKVLFGNPDESYDTTPPWARVQLNLVRALMQLGHEVVTVDGTASSLREAHSLHERNQIDVIQTMGRFENARMAIRARGSRRVPLIHWILNDPALSKKECIRILTEDIGLTLSSRERLLGYLVGAFVPTQLRLVGLREVHYVAPTSHVAAHLGQLQISDFQISVIPPGVDSDLFSPPMGSFEENERDVLRVLFFGACNLGRGLDLVRRVFRGLSEDKRIETVMAVWGGPKRIDGLRNHGFRGDLPELLRSSDIVLLPYQTTFSMTSVPLTLLESFAAGRPVVTTDLPNILEVAHHMENSMIVCTHRGKSEAVSSIVKALQYLSENPSLRRDLSKRARDDAVALFDWPKIADRFIELYSRLVR